jgi:uncharacterized protein YlzI (FlbEa/FlbD family)
MLDYESQAQSRLVNQFNESPKLRAIVAALVAEFTNIENTLDLMKSDRWIETAQGAQLDGSGYIVGEPRRGRDDDAYREAIRFRVFVNVSNGTPQYLIRGLSFLTKPDDAQYMEQYPATTMLFTNGPIVQRDIQRVIQDISPAAISTVPVMVSYTALPFRFGRESDPAELFVHMDADYLEVDGSDMQVTGQQTATNGTAFGGVVPGDLDVDDQLLELSDGSILVVHNPNTDGTIGHYHLPGVFQ